MTRTALLIGTSFSAAPLARHLKGMGWRVTVCGNSPRDPCVSWADAYLPIDYAEPQALLDIARQGHFDALCPSCNDYAYHSGVHVAAALGLPGYDPPEVAEVLADKAMFRRHLANIGLPSPRAWQPNDSMPAKWKGELLVKPVDSFSGKGITRLVSPHQLDDAVASARTHSRRGDVVIEEYVAGTLHSHSAFLHRQRVVADVFVDEFCTIYPYQVNCSNSPSRLPRRIRLQMREAIDVLAASLGLVDGLLHTQFIVRGEEIYLIETMRRAPGDLYPRLIELSTRMPYIANYLAPYLGVDAAALGGTEAKPWARHTISFPRDTLVESYSWRLPEASQIIHYPLRESGTLVRAAPHDKAGILFARFRSKAELFRLTEHLGRRIRITPSGHDRHG